jgi:hypothetical protein
MGQFSMEISQPPGQFSVAINTQDKAALGGEDPEPGLGGGLGADGSGFIDDPQQVRGACGNHSAHCLEDRMLDASIRKLHQQCGRFTFRCCRPSWRCH